jgi:LysM repeat protein
MSDRPTADAGPLACPFVALDDDRGRRSVAPDHRHRCFAELRPAPRALAHQETYCLTASFAACPTFQDWARRQAAREVAGGAREVETTGPMPSEALSSGEAPSQDEAPPHDDHRPPRRPRDWTAPPPWMADRSPSPAGEQLGVFDALDEAEPRAGVDPELASLLRPGDEPGLDEDEGEVPAFLADRSRSATPRSSRPPAGRPVSQARPVSPKLRRPDHGDPDAPPWERPRRFEAYPTLRSRAAIPRIPGMAIALVALGAAALLLFFLPSLLTAPASTPAPSPTATATATSNVPTEVPSPTAQVYVVVANDTISKIAKTFDLTQEELLAANPQIKNPDKIAVGDEIFIPVPATLEPSPSEASPSP